LLVAIACTLSGCSQYASDMKKAAGQELAGDYAGALALYDRAVPKIPQDRFAERSQGFLRLGECLLRLERMTDAFNSFQRALELDPNNLEARRRVAELLIASGHPEYALEHADYILARDPRDASGLALLGAAAAAQGDQQRAEKYYRDTLSVDPARLNISLALVEMLQRLDRTDEARAVLLASTAAVPANPMPWLALGRLEEQEGRIAAAESAYRSAVRTQDSDEANRRLAQFLQRIGRIGEAQSVLQHLDERQPKLPPALADLQLNLGKAEEALAIYGRRLSAMLATDAEITEQRRVLVRMIESQLEEGGNHKYARSLLRQGVGTLEPSTQAALEAEIALHEHDIAEADRKSALAVDLSAAGDPSALYVRGLALYQQKSFTEARSMWSRALSVDPLHVPALTMMARAHLEAGQPVEAEKYIVPVIREEPANLKGLLLYGRILLAQGRREPARAIAQRAATVAQDRAEPLVLLGDVSVQQGSLARALVEFQKAVLIAPDNAQALDGLLRVYRAGKFTRYALRKLERVADAPPRSATLHEIAGRLYAEKGWKDDAIRALKRAIEIDAQRASAAIALTETYSEHGDLRSAAEVAIHSAPLNRTSPASTSLLAALESDSRQALSESERNYEMAVLRGEESGIAANNLAWLYAAQGRKLDRALELAVSARAKHPQDPAVLDTLGFVQLRRGEYSAAVETLQEAENLSDAVNRASIQAHLAEAYSRAGLHSRPDAISK
jgi:tetratricopeptide (TPR) repeat protein